jgi:hypothetical protein
LIYLVFAWGSAVVLNSSEDFCLVCEWWGDHPERRPFPDPACMTLLHHRHSSFCKWSQNFGWKPQRFSAYKPTVRHSAKKLKLPNLTEYLTETVGELTEIKFERMRIFVLINGLILE